MALSPRSGLLYSKQGARWKALERGGGVGGGWGAHARSFAHALEGCMLDKGNSDLACLAFSFLSLQDAYACHVRQVALHTAKKIAGSNRRPASKSGAAVLLEQTSVRPGTSSPDQRTLES
eukprot:1160393-Pelagomonas_calceolata.AAC.18